MVTCACRCGCQNEFKRNHSIEIAVIEATHKAYKQTLCDYCMENNHKNMDFSTPSNDDPITILKRRLASGEISRSEYEELKTTLEE